MDTRETRETLRGMRHTKGVDEELAVNASNNFDDYAWDVLLSDHMRLARMFLKRRGWGLVASMSQLETGCSNVRCVGNIAR